MLAIARDMEKGVVAREMPTGEPQRLAVVERTLAEEMALRGWIVCLSPESRVQRYRLAAPGKAMLRSGGALRRRSGFADSAATFVAAPAMDKAAEDDRLHHMRSALGETPLLSLSRRQEEKGEPFLTRQQLATGERLREDFELATRQEEVPTDWEQVVEWLSVASGSESRPSPSGALPPEERLGHALRELGPGMAEVALRCCCLLEGLETVERRLGWSARSGKIVLRIALWRLQQRYRAEDARTNPLIG